MIGSVTRKSECITAVMVLVPAAKAGVAKIAESAIAGKANFATLVERCQSEL
jgi:hypothetical protein